MAKAKEVIVTPDPRLRKKSVKVKARDPEVEQIIKEMIDSCIDWENKHEFELTTAMAAPQLGYNKRIYDYEGCLSVPAIYGKVPRPAKARIKAQLDDGTEVRLKANDFLARTLLHEIDHLNGILFIDHIKGQKDAFYKLNDRGDLEPLDYDTYIKNNKDLYPDGDGEEN